MAVVDTFDKPATHLPDTASILTPFTTNLVKVIRLGLLIVTRCDKGSYLNCDNFENYCDNNWYCIKDFVEDICKDSDRIIECDSDNYRVPSVPSVPI